MHKNAQKGSANAIILAVVIAGISIAVALAQNRTNLLPKYAIILTGEIL